MGMAQNETNPNLCQDICNSRAVHQNPVAITTIAKHKKIVQSNMLETFEDNEVASPW
jgi:hypothetical protein